MAFLQAERRPELAKLASCMASDVNKVRRPATCTVGGIRNGIGVY